MDYMLAIIILDDFCFWDLSSCETAQTYTTVAQVNASPLQPTAERVSEDNQDSFNARGELVSSSGEITTLKAKKGVKRFGGISLFPTAKR